MNRNSKLAIYREVADLFNMKSLDSSCIARVVVDEVIIVNKHAHSAFFDIYSVVDLCRVYNLSCYIDIQNDFLVVHIY